MSDFQSTLRTAHVLRNQMKTRPDDLVPPALAKAMAGLIVAVVLLVAIAQLTDRPNSGVLIEAPIVAERQIVLTGDRAGAYVATDIYGTQIALSSEDKAGFIGVIGLVFARARDARDVAPGTPIRVVRRTNGNIAVIDDATGMVVELIGYGADNIAAFARMVD